MNNITESLLHQFDESIKAWRPREKRSGTAGTFRKDRAELTKIRTAFKRGQHRRVIEMTDELDTIVRSKVPRAVLEYCDSAVRAHTTIVPKS